MIEKTCEGCDCSFLAKHAGRSHCSARCIAIHTERKEKPFREWSPERKEKYNTRRRENSRQCRIDVFNALGTKCCTCGFSDHRALQIDHVNGGGVKELRSNGNRLSYYKKVLKSIHSEEGTYQLLCANCNWIKRHVNNEK